MDAIFEYTVRQQLREVGPIRFSQPETRGGGGWFGIHFFTSPVYAQMCLNSRPPLKSCRPALNSFRRPSKNEPPAAWQMRLVKLGGLPFLPGLCFETPKTCPSGMGRLPCYALSKDLQQAGFSKLALEHVQEAQCKTHSRPRLKGMWLLDLSLQCERAPHATNSILL